MEANSDLFIRMIETCLHLGRYDEAAEYAERGRSRALVDILHADNLQPRNVPADKVDAYRQLRRAAEALEALLAQQYDSGTGLPAGPQSQRNSPAGILPDAHVSLLTERAAVYMRLWNLEDEIRQADPEFYMLAKPLRVADMAKLAGRLQRTLVMLWVGATKGAAFFVEPSGAFSHLPLPDVTDAMLRSWIFGISSDPSRGGWIGTYLRFREDPSKRREWTEQMSRTLANIHERLMKPIRDRLNTLQTARGTGAPHADDWGATPPPHRIALIAGGALGLLPFHAAADYRPDGKVNYLIDDFDIAYAPSAWILQRCVNRTRGRDLRMLAVGDPERSDSRPLPFAVWETDNISQMVQSVHAGTVDLLQGADGTTEQVHRLLPSHPIAHFSCHGEWNFQEPMQSALLLAGTGVLSLADLLTQIEMSQSKLVVLSACESGAGCRLGVGGEEYLGLPAGFMVAGARTVVGSLWSVLDPPTGLLMKRFYQHLLKGMEVTDALRRAQLWLKDMTRDEAFAEVGAIFPRKQTVTDGSTDLMEKYREWLNGLDEKPFAHPYYWAAFEVFGSPDGVYYEEFVSHAGSPGITEGKSGPL
jgi:CHAT domain-containing protein